ncbi:hypothetical protein [Pelosinus sp. IPA-1]|uniref:hypothetical protein n=1 Tax=Pelosinus sp. IPA-1 TaxID=3029569 RepID=UPI002436221A|nr:hypothetical protein [Pelosinus sp. IPA-1]GMB02063.1 hypothetical protein PIPA1_48630 [Pelosinus sp. IPA-1]
MPDISQQICMFIISWVFWFIIISLFAYLFQKKRGIILGTQERIFLVGKVSFLCVAASVLVNAVLGR